MNYDCIYIYMMLACCKLKEVRLYASRFVNPRYDIYLPAYSLGTLSLLQTDRHAFATLLIRPDFPSSSGGE
jgi:hypothetical protein